MRAQGTHRFNALAVSLPIIFNKKVSLTKSHRIYSIPAVHLQNGQLTCRMALQRDNNKQPFHWGLFIDDFLIMSIVICQGWLTQFFSANNGPNEQRVQILSKCITCSLENRKIRSLYYFPANCCFRISTKKESNDAYKDNFQNLKRTQRSFCQSFIHQIGKATESTNKTSISLQVIRRKTTIWNCDFFLPSASIQPSVKQTCKHNQQTIENRSFKRKRHISYINCHIGLAAKR